MTDDLIFRRRALADGITDSEIRRARRSGQLVRIAAGAYVSDAHFAGLDACALHRIRIAAALQSRPPGVVVSHASAALLHDMDVGDIPLQRVHLTRNHTSGGGRTAGVHVHAAPFDASDVVVVGGLPVTSAARTVVATARISTFDQAVVVGDSALHRRLVTLDHIGDVIDRSGPRKGIATARRAAGFLDRRSESPGESLSRSRIRRHGLPSPQLQRVLHDSSGAFLGRVDFFWEADGVVGEFDGLGKYGVDSGQAAVAVHREKLREDAIRDAGFEVKDTCKDIGYLPTQLPARPTNVPASAGSPPARAPTSPVRGRPLATPPPRF
ncbi:type IV toxin-antitoxin system AbiEi family antitoxin domain-containing protein [Rhodococcus sp. WAY2]|uniref:type IV toxin-antitoxin system AbiEi family antitoxin domain-containing protein n=1 Tax=Rhodococcus sp. WAY2 TaxID=2663121 RepID=UPI001F29EE25|nr:type IV toxin-antitoxin system AbiEi family antitoxin domain-containing protein [Rhodococcus sp. WAY2]